MKCWPQKASKIVCRALLLVATLWVSEGLAQNSIDTDTTEADFRRISNRLLCQCGCNYMVLSCNHLECPSATYIRKAIRTSLAEGKADEEIVASFVEQYGVRILPEPPKEGFSWMAWIMPFLALVLGGGVVSYVLWVWKKRPSTAAADSDASTTETDATPENELSAALVEKYRAQIDQELENE